MTPVMLMQALQGFIERETADLKMQARVKRNSGEKAERPPGVYIGELPEPEGTEKLAPYVLMKFLTGKHERNPGEDENNVGRKNSGRARGVSGGRKPGR